MAEILSQFKGKVILFASIEATPEGAAEVEASLKRSRENALSDKEPGCLNFRVNRLGNKFGVFEEYLDVPAIQFHSQQAPYQELLKLGEKGLLAKPPQFEFYEEVP